MDDYMDNQKATDLLDNLLGMVEDNQGNDYNAALKMGIEALKAHTQPEQRWIPCSERLPEFDTKVLAWVENKDPKGRFNSPGVYTATLCDKIPQHDPEGKRNDWGIPGYDSEWTVWSWSYFSEPDVKAWMPLPEPYKGGEQND